MTTSTVLSDLNELTNDELENITIDLLLLAVAARNLTGQPVRLEALYIDGEMLKLKLFTYSDRKPLHAGCELSDYPAVREFLLGTASTEDADRFICGMLGHIFDHLHLSWDAVSAA